MHFIINKSNRESLGVRRVCAYCEGKVLRITEQKILRLFIFMPITLSTKQYLSCSSCKRTLNTTDLKQLPDFEREIKKTDSGRVEEIRVSRTNKLKQTRFVINTANEIPDVKDPELLCTTAVAVMTLMCKYDESLSMDDASGYQHIQNSFSAYRDKMSLVQSRILNLSEDEAYKEVISLYQQCLQTYHSKPVTFIENQCISVAAWQTELHKDVYGLFEDMLEMRGVGDLAIDAHISRMRMEQRGF